MLIMNYFTRFVWAQGYLKYIANEIIDIYKSHNFPIFGQSKAVYSNNDFHFDNQKVQNYFQKKEVIYFTMAINHLLSIRLLE